MERGVARRVVRGGGDGLRGVGRGVGRGGLRGVRRDIGGGRLRGVERGVWRNAGRGVRRVGARRQRRGRGCGVRVGFDEEDGHVLRRRGQDAVEFVGVGVALAPDLLVHGVDAAEVGEGRRAAHPQAFRQVRFEPGEVLGAADEDGLGLVGDEARRAEPLGQVFLGVVAARLPLGLDTQLGIPVALPGDQRVQGVALHAEIPRPGDVAGFDSGEAHEGPVVLDACARVGELALAAQLRVVGGEEDAAKLFVRRVELGGGRGWGRCL
ncbi:putative acetyltransferase [Streptomyces sp. Tu6071]|nr:putative acetyltransferase [Streptomyces sp. Tu6071]